MTKEIFQYPYLVIRKLAEKEIQKYIFSTLSAYRLYPEIPNEIENDLRKDIMKFFDCFYQINDPFYLTDEANKQFNIKKIELENNKKKNALIRNAS